MNSIFLRNFSSYRQKKLRYRRKARDKGKRKEKRTIKLNINKEVSTEKGKEIYIEKDKAKKKVIMSKKSLDLVKEKREKKEIYKEI